MNNASFIDNSSYALDPRLAKEAIAEHQLPISQILLRNEQCFPWLIMVPRQANLLEIFDLSEDHQALFWKEMTEVSDVLKDVTQADKINIAAFGNMVSQLHVHIIARHKTDPLWPENVVGAKQADAYRDHQPPDWWSSFLERLARKDLNKP